MGKKKKIRFFLCKLDFYNNNFSMIPILKLKLTYIYIYDRIFIKKHAITLWLITLVFLSGKKQNKKDFFPYFNTLHNEKNAYFHCSNSKKNKIFNIILIV